MNENQTSYQAPTLVKVGDAEDTVRGFYGAGFDADTLFMLGSGQEFQSELDLND